MKRYTSVVWKKTEFGKVKREVSTTSLHEWPTFRPPFKTCYPQIPPTRLNFRGANRSFRPRFPVWDGREEVRLQRSHLQKGDEPQLLDQWLIPAMPLRPSGIRVFRQWQLAAGLLAPDQCEHELQANSSGD